MGRAMLIICAGTLISLGIISMNTSQRGQSMTANAAGYASQMTAKNAAHSAIQSAMQEINQEGQDEDGDWIWIKNHGPGDEWDPTIDNAQIKLYIEYEDKGEEYFDPDIIRMVSKATYANKYEAEVISLYMVGPFSTLVPEFSGAVQLPTGFNSFTADGNAHSINGKNADCEEDKPPVTVNSSETKKNLDDENLNMDGEIAVDEELDYEPTDELIERLENSGNATTVDSDYSDDLGTADDPGIFFIDGNVKLTGQQSEGYGIMVVKNSADMEYEDEDGNTLDIRGNFEFNGLVIFENAELFDGRGTPTINGSVLVGDTEGETDIDIELGGNIEINYDCNGERYSNMAAADAEEQNRYSRIVTYE